MTDLLITELGRTEGVKVISRTSSMRFKNSTIGLPRIATELGVEAVVEGSALARGDHLRVTTQLVDAADDTTVWSQTFERRLGESFELQRDIASSIVSYVCGALALRGQARRLRTMRTSSEAQGLFLKGRYFFQKPTVPA